MDTPGSSPHASDIDEGMAEGHHVSNFRGPSHFMSANGGDGVHRGGPEDRGGPRRGGQGKNQIVLIDQEVVQRWNAEIGDVLADTIATSKVVIPEPLPVGTTIPQVPPAAMPENGQEASAQKVSDSKA
ncbi:hypothetical protein NliqN6_3296 [Naganishia liquefaciens]|uniref:Uncharacterized protein n=1 Tax=Naganishia liquefaciens TaxID=104408 RepID=A0A8H3TTR8_9TREE|nr:hypothetical protein NliqN6_3296 [Naganishia liquefaciens]